MEVAITNLRYKVESICQIQILNEMKLYNLLFLVLIFRSIDTLKVFDIIWGTTGGGPGLATEALQTYAYRVAYSFLEMSKSMTVMVLFSIVVIFLTITYSRFNKDI